MGEPQPCQPIMHHLRFDSLLRTSAQFWTLPGNRKCLNDFQHQTSSSVESSTTALLPSYDPCSSGDRRDRTRPVHMIYWRRRTDSVFLHGSHRLVGSSSGRARPGNRIVPIRPQSSDCLVSLFPIPSRAPTAVGTAHCSQTRAPTISRDTELTVVRPASSQRVVVGREVLSR